MAVAAIARFATLDQQSYWYDEAVTVGLIRMDFGDMLDRIPDSESTPPLYYIARVAVGEGVRHGRGRAAVAVGAPGHGLRAGRLPDRRPRRERARRLVAAALAALNPLLVWYSQEARVYSMLVLVSGLSFLFFIRLLTGDPRRRTLVLWAVISARRARHALLRRVPRGDRGGLAARQPRRTGGRSRSPRIGLAVVELAHLPLLLHQRSLDLADFIDEIPLGYRVARTPKQFLVGFDAPGEVISAIVAGALVVLALWLVWSRGDDRERRAALIGAVVGGTLLVDDGAARPDRGRLPRHAQRARRLAAARAGRRRRAGRTPQRAARAGGGRRARRARRLDGGVRDRRARSSSATTGVTWRAALGEQRRAARRRRHARSRPRSRSRCTRPSSS